MDMATQASAAAPKPGNLDELRELIARESERLTPRMRDAARHALEHPNDVALSPIAAVAAAAATKQPLTKRGVARSVAFFTSSTAPEHADHAAIPDSDTLVQYMGGREAIITAQRLLDQGRLGETPVVVIENCSRPDQRILRLTLATLAHGLGAAHGPVLVMLGDAMAMRAHQAPGLGEAEEVAPTSRLQAAARARQFPTAGGRLRRRRALKPGPSNAASW
eukprot:gene16206-33980_t